MPDKIVIEQKGTAGKIFIEENSTSNGVLIDQGLTRTLVMNESIPSVISVLHQFMEQGETTKDILTEAIISGYDLEFNAGDLASALLKDFIVIRKPQ